MRSRLICALYSTVILTFSLLLLFSPWEDFSPYENRTLRKMPVPTLESIADKSFSSAFSSFCADQFPFRARLLSLDSELDLTLGRLESKKIMMGREHNLIKRCEYESLDSLNANLAQIESLKELAASNGNDAIFICAPRGVDVLRDFCPPLFDGTICDKAFDRIGDADALRATLRQRALEGEYVYYKTDHHWTALGAYYAYCEIIRTLGGSPIPLDRFSAVELTDSFYGTSYSASLFGGAYPDRLWIYTHGEHNRLSVTDAKTGRSLALYDYGALSGGSAYDVFLGGNRALTRVTSGDKPDLTLVKDSFANSLVPLLSLHYDLTIIDPRYLKEPIAPLISSLWEQNGKSPLLFLFGVDTLCTGYIFPKQLK